MFGSKLRSWMEAVRPRKKQQRKEKQQKSAPIVANFKPVANSRSSENEILVRDSFALRLFFDVCNVYRKNAI